MNLKTKLTLYFLFAVFSICCIYIFKDTYATFETNANAKADFDVGNWVIKLNEMDISSGDTVSFSANNFVYDENSHVKDGYIAPGREGYFDIVLDPTGTEVAVRYDISLDISEGYEDNISYTVTALEGTTIKSGENIYSGVLSLDKVLSNEIVTLRINLIWDNSSSYDAQDTMLGLEQGSNIEILANVSVHQYLGEVIEEYNE